MIITLANAAPARSKGRMYVESRAICPAPRLALASASGLGSGDGNDNMIGIKLDTRATCIIKINYQQEYFQTPNLYLHDVILFWTGWSLDQE